MHLRAVAARDALLVALAVAVGASGCSPSGESPSPPPPGSPEVRTPATGAARDVTPSPAPTRAESTGSGGTYLALGDSLAVGVGAASPAQGGYVARVAASRSEMTLRNLAVSGETSASFIGGGQLAMALDAMERSEPPVALVTLDIGGNDLLRLLWTEPCASAPETDACRQLVLMTVMQFEENYRRIVADLADAIARHAPNARLAVLTYFNPFSGTDASHERAAEIALLGTDGVVDCDRSGLTDRGMNDVIACVGRDAAAIVVDVHPSFTGLGLDLTHIGSDDIHANDRGYEVIAAAILDALPDGS